MTTPQPLSAADLLVALVDGGVDFLVVGGVAVQAHGHPRTTKDLDVLVRRSPENYERLAGVLDHLGVDDTAQELTGFQTLDSGAAEFDAMNARALVLPFRGREVRTVGLDDLLAMKRAAGREQDRRDIAALTRVNDR